MTGMYDEPRHMTRANTCPSHQGSEGVGKGKLEKNNSQIHKFLLDYSHFA